VLLLIAFALAVLCSLTLALCNGSAKYVWTAGQLASSLPFAVVLLSLSRPFAQVLRGSDNELLEEIARGELPD
jgi:membrane protein implicated in regulation of membrane protease activity